MNIFKTNLVVVFLLHSPSVKECLCLEWCSGPAYRLVVAFCGKIAFCLSVLQFSNFCPY